MKHIKAFALGVLIALVFWIPVSYAYNPYALPKSWEARERFENPQNFTDGYQARHWERQHDRFEADKRREREQEDYRRSLESDSGY